MQYTIAAGISSEVVSDLRPSRSLSSSARFSLAIPAAGGANTMTSSPKVFYLASDGTLVSSGSNLSLYRVSIGFAPPAAASKASTPVRILVSWPAQAYPNTSVWPDNLNDSFEVLTTLDRN